MDKEKLEVGDVIFVKSPSVFYKTKIIRVTKTKAISSVGNDFKRDFPIRVFSGKVYLTVFKLIIHE